MSAQSSNGYKHAARVIDQQLEGLLDDIQEIRNRLDRLEQEAAAMETEGLAASQFLTSIGGGSTNVDVRKYAELDARVQTINALRHVVALSAGDGS